MSTHSKIYTKTGDQGTTRLVDGSCVEKFNPRVEAYGTVDELNSQLGMVRALAATEPRVQALDSMLSVVQSQLFTLGSLLACEKDEVFQKLNPITPAQVLELEKQIDALDGQLQPLRNFVLPAGPPVTAALHIARTVCRRAERRSAEISMKDERYAVCLMYLNRLSDFLFVAARWSNLQTGTGDVLWKGT